MGKKKPNLTRPIVRVVEGHDKVFLYTLYEGRIASCSFDTIEEAVQAGRRFLNKQVS